MNNRLKCAPTFLSALALLIAFACACAASDVPSLPEGVVAFWTAGDEGDAVPDISGNGHDGVLMGTARKPARVESEFLGDVLHFTHVDSRDGGPCVSLNVSSKINPPEPEMTVAAWIKLDGDGAGRNNFIIGMVGSYELAVSFGRLRFRYIMEDGQSREFIVPREVSVINPGNWHFVAAALGDGRIDMYIDGKNSISEEAEGYPARKYTATLGNYSPGFTLLTFRGSIGPVLMFNRALSAPEITGLMAYFLR